MERNVWQEWVMALVMACMAVTVTAASGPGDFRRLDSLISVQPQLVEAKEARLAAMKARLGQEAAPGKRYEAMMALYDEYAAYQYDSACAYVSAALQLARAAGDIRQENEARLGLAHILSTACLMDKAQQALDAIDTAQLTSGQLIQYHRCQTDLYIYQAEYMQGTQYAGEYITKLVDLRRRIQAIDVPHDDVNYLLTASECLADDRRPGEAISLLEALMGHYHSGERMYSIITSMMAFYYSQLGDEDSQMQYLIKSAESDLEGCIRENTSMRAIADLLLDRGDIDRAYRYMRVAVDDANFYGTRLRNIQASRIVPKILDAYHTRQQQSRRNMLWLLVAISVVALLLVGAVIAVYQLLKRYRRLNEAKHVINEQLRQAGAQLGETVGLLREREKLKEEYIARFLILSSRFIDRGEEQRKALYRLHRDRKTEELARELKSTHHGQENARLFYENFDNAFLNIYPAFVDEVNKLLQPDGRIEVKTGKRLTTESRVLALIRIGITDNQSIASILRASLTTIYTYRSRLKARAIDKENFEAQVKAIDC